VSGPRIAVAAIVLAFVAPGARAQDVVPGGWASEVGVQSFHAPGETNAYPGLSGYGVTSTPNVMIPPAGVIGGAAWYSPPPVVAGMRTHAQTFNALGPLGDTIRKSSRKRTRR
jgi:hypothetical protein